MSELSKRKGKERAFFSHLQMCLLRGGEPIWTLSMGKEGRTHEREFFSLVGVVPKVEEEATFCSLRAKQRIRIVGGRIDRR